MHTSIRIQWLIGIVLASFIILTRGHHFASINHLPAFSWAAFLLAGFYLRSLMGFGALFALCVGLDFIALTWGGGDNSSCFTIAYGMLLPAYFSLWFAGRWYQKYHSNTLKTVLPLVVLVLLGTFACELLSSGGYYIFSGKFTPNLHEFSQRLSLYYPRYLSSVVFYVGITIGVHAFIVWGQKMNLFPQKTH